MLGLRVDALGGAPSVPARAGTRLSARNCRPPSPSGGPFLDFVFSRVNPDGSQQKFQVSGEPMFGPACQFLGYRGIGLEITNRK